MLKFVSAILATWILILAPPAWACDVPDQSWRVQFDRPEVVLTAPGDPVALLLVNGTNAPALEGEMLSVTLFRNNEEVGSSYEILPSSEDVARLVVTPAEPVDDSSEYTVQLDSGSIYWSLLPETVAFSVEPEPEAQATITEIEGHEVEQEANIVCCDIACVTDCGGEHCEACWPTSWTYPVRVQLSWESGALPLGKYDFELYRKDEAGEPELLQQLLDFRGATEFSANAGGRAYPRFAEDWGGERCFRVDAVHFETQDRVIGDWECLDSFEPVERDGPPPPPDPSGSCEAPLMTEEGEEYAPPTDDIMSTGKEGGCSSVNAEQPPIWLMGLVLAVWRRRRPAQVAPLQSLCSVD